MWLLAVKYSRFTAEFNRFWQVLVILIVIYSLSLYQANLGPGRLCSFTIRADSCSLVLGLLWLKLDLFTLCHCILVIRILQLSTVAWKRSTGHKLTCILFLKIPPPLFLTILAIFFFLWLTSLKISAAILVYMRFRNEMHTCYYSWWVPPCVMRFCPL